MLKSLSRVGLLLCVAAIGASCAQSTVTNPRDPNVQHAQVVDGVRSVPVYPVIWPEMPAGPNKNLYLSNCVVCHSQLYVLMQPPFSRKIWTAEVQKMKQSYGATIEDANIPPIVDYLVAIRGDEPRGTKN